MTTSQEEIKDWIRYGFDRNAQYMFIIKDTISLNIRPYWVKTGENPGLIRTILRESGENIVAELNMDVKLLLTKEIK